MSLSTFPNQIDTFLVRQDIQASDVTNLNRYKILKLTANRTPAEDTELNNLTTTLRDKLLLPEDFNKLTDSIVAVETFTLQTILDYYTYRGDWVSSPNPAYKAFNSVRYIPDGQIYMAIVAPGIAAPTDASKWVLLSRKGDQGIQGLPGVGLVYKGTFSPSTSYVVNDLVTYNGNTYYCIQNIQGVYPTNATYWTLFMAGMGENLADLETDVKTSLVLAINEVNTNADAADNKIGVLSSMNTTDKASIVSAINELLTRIDAAKKYQS